MALGLGGSLVKGMIGGALKERAKNIGKTKVGKLLAREGRVMMGKPQPKAQVGAPAQTVQPQQTLAPGVPSAGGGGGGGSKFATEKEAALSIKNTTIQVATLLKGSYVLEKEQLKNKKKTRQKTKRKGAESALEKAKGMVSGFKMPAMPGKGLLDSVFGFVGQLVFGMVMMKLVDFLPTLKHILPTIGRIADWIIGAGGFILNQLARFINWGYKLVDGMENMVKGIFGEEGAEKFKTFMTNIKDLIAAFLVWKFLGKKIVTALVKNIKLAWTIAKGIVANAFKIVNFLTGGLAQKGLTAATRGLTRIGTSIAKRTGLTAAKKMGGSLFKHGAKRAGKRVLLKMMGKTFVKAAGKIFGRVPIVGPLIVGLVSLVSGEPIGQALFKAFGAGLGGFLGGIAGAAITAAIGTVTAGIGLVLVPIITPASMMIGEILGTFVGDMLYGLIFGGGLSGVGKALKNAFTGIFQKIAEGLKWITDLPIVSQLIQIVQNPGSALLNFGRWVFFDAIPWLMGKAALAAKLLKEWFHAGMVRFVDNFPLFDLPLMKFSLFGINVDLNWLLGKAFGLIPWFKQWINGEDQLMHFPDFSMFVPVLGLPFLTGHIGKSLFPGSFFKSWPSGISAGVNPLGKALGAKWKEGQDEVAEMRKKYKEKGLWNTLFNRGDKTESNALKKKNEGEKGSSKRYSQEEYDKMKADYMANPTSGGAMRLNRYARGLKAQNQAEFGGTGEAFTLGDKTYQPGDEGYLEAINAAQSAMHGDNTQLSKLQTANQQGGAKAVIESISTTASYDKNETEVVTVPAPKKTAVEDISGPGGGGGAPLVVSGAGEGGADPYEILYKGS